MVIESVIESKLISGNRSHRDNHNSPSRQRQTVGRQLEMRSVSAALSEISENTHHVMLLNLHLRTNSYVIIPLILSFDVTTFHCAALNSSENSMRDLDCGVKTWYKRPSFYVKIVWAILTIAGLGVGGMATRRLRDPFFPIACSRIPGNLLAAMLFFFTFSAILQVGTFFRRQFCEVIRFGQMSTLNIVVLVHCIWTLIYLLLLIVFCAKYGTQQAETKFHAAGIFYYYMHPDTPESKWFADKTACEEGKEMMGKCAKYFDVRGTQVTSGMLTVSLPWFLCSGYLAIKALLDEFESGLGYASIVEDRGQYTTAD